MDKLNTVVVRMCLNGLVDVTEYLSTHPLSMPLLSPLFN